jgi:hypothetical protein
LTGAAFPLQFATTKPVIKAVVITAAIPIVASFHGFHFIGCTWSSILKSSSDALARLVHTEHPKDAHVTGVSFP